MFSEISISQKSGHVLRSGLSRSHSPVPQILYWSQTESNNCSLDCLSRKLGHPRISLILSYPPPYDRGHLVELVVVVVGS